MFTTVEERRMVRRRGSLFSCLSLVAPTLLDAYEYSISLERYCARRSWNIRLHGSYRFWGRDMADLDCVDDHSNHGEPMYKSTGAERFGLSA